MDLIHQRDRLRKEMNHARAGGDVVGLVPTMGALHEGHASLIRKAASECDTVAVSVFVNPLQFGPLEDLASYPRCLDADLAVAARAGASLVFAPTIENLWPAGLPVTVVAVGAVTSTLEGGSRPGHFDGVATVVATLLGLAGTCRAYFGEKDFQQLVVVRRLVEDLGLAAEVAACPTVREIDGLALSSRNAFLSASERRAAPVLSQALAAARNAYASGERAGEVIGRIMALVIEAETSAHLDYAEVVDPVSLVPVDRVVSEARLMVAARVGAVRLIDNMAVGSS